MVQNSAALLSKPRPQQPSLPPQQQVAFSKIPRVLDFATSTAGIWVPFVKSKPDLTIKQDHFFDTFLLSLTCKF